MTRRSCMGHVARMSTGFLRLLNLVVLLGAITTVAIFFVIKNKPTFPEGWGFIALGGVTIVSGLFGLVSSGQFGCFGIHLLFALLSTAGLCVSFLVIFIKPDAVLDAVQYDGLSRSDKKQLLRINGAIFLALFGLQLVIFLLSCLVQCCNFYDYYEDLEGQQLSAKQVAKEQMANEKRKGQIEATSAHKLAEKMKEKYGSYDRESH